MVEAFMHQPDAAEALQGLLSQLPDCGRLLPRTAKALAAMLPQV